MVIFHCYVSSPEAIENGPVEIVDLPHVFRMVIFHSFLLTFTRPGIPSQGIRKFGGESQIDPGNGQGIVREILKCPEIDKSSGML